MSRVRADIHGATGDNTSPHLLRDYFNLTNLIYNKLTNLIMKQNTMTEVMGYEAPNFDVVLAVVERGFEASLPGVSINPWVIEDDSLVF